MEIIYSLRQLREKRNTYLALQSSDPDNFELYQVVIDQLDVKIQKLIDLGY